MTATVSASALRIPHSRIRELAEVAMTMDGVLKLYFGESSLPTPDYIKRAAQKAMADGFTFYTENAGLPSLRKALARYYQDLQGVDAGPCYGNCGHGFRGPGAQPRHPLRARSRRRSISSDAGLAEWRVECGHGECSGHRDPAAFAGRPVRNRLRCARSRGHSAHPHAPLYFAIEPARLGGNGPGSAEAARFRAAPQSLADG